VHLYVHLITASKCIAKYAQLRPPSASPNRSITASKCISKLARSQPPSVSHCLHDYGLQVYLQTSSITASKYIFKERRRVYGNTGVTEVDRGTGSIFGRPRSRQISCHFHLILSYNENTHSFFPNFWSHLLCPRCHGSSTPGSIISSHLIPRLLEPETLFQMNSVWMSREVSRSDNGGLSAFYLHLFTTTASKWGISKFSQWVCRGAPPIMLDYYLRPD